MKNIHQIRVNRTNAQMRGELIKLHWFIKSCKNKNALPVFNAAKIFVESLNLLSR